MKLLQVAEQNKSYYSADYTKGFNDGAKAQYEADRKKAERHGRWEIKLDKNRLFYECKCSVCGHIESFDPKYRWFNYCPNCGTRLEGESE